MSKGNTFENDLVSLIFLGTPIAGIADNASVSPLTNLYVSLHTADPTAGNQNTSELTYPGYARVAIPRSSVGFLVFSNAAQINIEVLFPTKTSGADEIITHAAIGTDSSGTGKILHIANLTGAISAAIRTVGVGETPIIRANSTSFIEE